MKSYDMMQSSLLRFLARREKEVASREKRPAESGASGCEVEAKKPKLAGQSSSLRKLKQFKRPKEVCRSSTNSTHQDVFVAKQPATVAKSVTSAEGSRPAALNQTEPDILFVEETRCDSNHGSTTESHSGASTSHSKSRSTSRSHSSPTSSDSKAHSHFQSKAKPGNAQGSGSRTPATAGTSKQYTPLEQQVVAIKAQHPDAVLFVECGYKYRFFGEDAEVASKLLRIGCFPDHNFMTASIPTHRLHVHLRRLVAAGYKVGVVKQTETAALKAASDKKSGPFSRELTGLYTRTTLLGPDVQGGGGGGEMTAGGGGGGEEVRGGGGCGIEEEEEGLYLMCLCEGRAIKRKGKEKETTIGFLAVQPSAGNMVYDEFTDLVSSFSELEMRLSHLQPAEVLYPQGGSGALEGALLEWRRYCGIPGLRFERLPEEWFDYCKAFQTVSSFYGCGSNTAPTTESEASSKEEDSAALQTVINLPATVLCCLGALVHHLKVFRLQRVLALTSNLQPFSTGSHFMRLNSKALEGLEIFRNLTDRTERGSLFWVLNHTHTSFGRRLLGKWISYPLRNITKLLARQEAVRELSCSESPCLTFAKGTLSRLPDLEKMLCSSYHRRCSPVEFYSMVKSLVRIQTEMQAYTDLALSDCKADLLQQVFKEVPLLLKEVQEFLDSLKEPAAKEVVYEDLFVKLENFPGILQEKKAIADLEQKLMDFRKQFRKTVGYPSANYVTVSGVQYLVEVKNRDVDRVPSDWTRVSGTKLVSRFHPPYVLEAVKRLAQHTEQLRNNARTAWGDFLSDFSCHYGSYKRAVELLALLDCLLSLAKVAKMPGYVCPALVEEPVIRIESGRHPVIDQLLGGGEQYVPNDTEISTSGLRAMIITGPNMGGKSSYIKQVALMCIMAQVGSFIPATSATLGILDAVYLRMGATDNIYTGKSTFMVELMEASEVMRLATPNSLVILDELGRGTSTHDGTAVAYATLTYFIEEVKCLTLFVTHYPLLAELEDQHPDTVGNFHMAYVEADTSEDYERIVFLYQLEKGRAGGSYGLNVAALAGLEKDLLRVAQRKSQQLKQAALEHPSEVEGISESCQQSFRDTLQLMQSEYSPRLLLEILNTAVQS